MYKRTIRKAIGLVLLLACAAPRAAQPEGDRALELIRQQCAFGPRVPNTPAHAKCGAWIAAQLRALGLTVVEQKYTAQLDLTGGTAESTNYYGLPAADGPTSGALLLTAHWDTRPYADRDPSGQPVPMPGANDGASGVALALEFARALRGTPGARRLVLLFHDAEDAGVNDKADSWGRGAQYAAAHPPKWIHRVRLGINLDMVAGENVPYIRDADSAASAPGAIEALWKLGSGMEPNYFSMAPPQRVADDHIPWIAAGVPFIDLLGLPWPYWHTAGDSPEHCSAAALQATGGVLAEFFRNGLK